MMISRPVEGVRRRYRWAMDIARETTRRGRRRGAEPRWKQPRPRADGAPLAQTRGSRSLVPQARSRPQDAALQRADHSGVELATGLAAHARVGDRMRKRVAVRALGRHRVERVADREDAG